MPTLGPSAEHARGDALLLYILKLRKGGTVSRALFPVSFVYGSVAVVVAVAVLTMSKNQ